MSSNSINKEILQATTDISLQNVDFSNPNLAERETLCDREPIHVPNSIQPHGVLLAVSAAEYQILQVSLNTSKVLGIEPQEMLNKPLSEFFGQEQVTTIQNCLAEDLDHINPLPIAIARKGTSLNFDGIVHRNEELVIIELEPTQPDQKVDFFDFYRLVKTPIDKIQSTNTLDELCSVIVQEVKKITNFDRVMVYRFDPEGSGTVIAEAANKELKAFLGLRYPATDIPKQAKYLYTLNFLRLIPDVKYEPVGIIPQSNPLTKQDLDLSMSVLRSVSPLHTEYLNNMGVGASMSISLIKNKQLWGLIACHHNTPIKISYKLRTICEFIGQIASFELVAKEAKEDADYKMKLKSIQSAFVASISEATELETGLTQNNNYLLDLVGAEGVALCFGEKFTLIGNTPEQTAIAQMLPWLETQFDEEVIFATNSLAEFYSLKPENQEIASGLLALLISRVEKTFIIWFRPEVIQTVEWAGNPDKVLEIKEDGTFKMSPRKSFAKWQETVKLKSLPWKDCEIEAALELRSSIVGILLRKSDELAQVNKELSRSNVELDSFAYIASHDLKEPLRGIYNYSSFLIEDYGEIIDEAGKDKLNTLMRLTHRMEDLINSLLHYSRLGRAELKINSVDLNDLIAGVLDVFKVSERDKQVKFIIPRPLPTIKGDRTQINELFTNLISNGIKYNQEAEKIIEIGYLNPDDPVVSQKMTEYPDNTPTKTVFYIRDNGIGIRERQIESIFRIFKRLHSQKKYGGGTGAGLTIVKKIAERHGGDIWVQSVYGEGSTFYFTLE